MQAPAEERGEHCQDLPPDLGAEQTLSRPHRPQQERSKAQMSRPVWEPRQHGPSSPRPWWRGHTIAAAVDGALVEDHDVLGQGARLVREDVLHLAQLLVQGGGAGLGGRPLLHAEHLLVPVDEVAVAQADDLHTAQGTGGEAEGGEGSRAPPPRAFAAGPPPGERREWSGADTWAGEGGKESLKVEPATSGQQRGSPTPTLQCPPDKKVQRAWAGGTDGTGRGGGTADKALDQFLPLG